MLGEHTRHVHTHTHTHTHTRTDWVIRALFDHPRLTHRLLCQRARIKRCAAALWLYDWCNVYHKHTHTHRGRERGSSFFSNSLAALVFRSPLCGWREGERRERGGREGASQCNGSCWLGNTHSHTHTLVIDSAPLCSFSSLPASLFFSVSALHLPADSWGILRGRCVSRPPPSSSLSSPLSSLLFIVSPYRAWPTFLSLFSSDLWILPVLSHLHTHTHRHRYTLRYTLMILAAGWGWGGVTKSI